MRIWSGLTLKTKGGFEAKIGDLVKNLFLLPVADHPTVPNALQYELPVKVFHVNVQSPGVSSHMMMTEDGAPLVGHEDFIANSLVGCPHLSPLNYVVKATRKPRPSNLTFAGLKMGERFIQNDGDGNAVVLIKSDKGWATTDDKDCVCFRIRSQTPVIRLRVK